MAYTKTTWGDGTTAITATRLNKIEQGIEDAHAGDVDTDFLEGKLVYGAVVNGSNGSTVVKSAALSVVRDGEGQYTVTHNFNSQSYVPIATPRAGTGGIMIKATPTTMTVIISTFDASGTLADNSFNIILVRIP